LNKGAVLLEIKQKKRCEIDDAFKWRLCDLYATDEIWREGFEAMKGKIPGFEKYKGKLSETDMLLACLKDWLETGEEISRLFVYAAMKLHEDTNISVYQGFADMAQTLSVQYMSAVSFIEPEILANADIIKALPDTSEVFKVYRHYLDNLLRKKEHILNAEIEEILAGAQEIGSAPDNIYAMMSDADMKFGSVVNEEGNTVELTHGRYKRMLESNDRRVREDAFNTYYDSYWKQKNTLAATYNASVKKDIFFSKTRKYASSLEAELHQFNIPKDVYTCLIETVHKFLPELHRYMRLRKKALGLEELHVYDLYTPLVKAAETKVPYEEGKAKLLKGLAVLGDEYVAAVKEGLDAGWVDVYENEGKRSGAYSWGSYGGHPYILMNYENKVDDMFTLAHEFGHAIHSYYSWATQPYLYGDYTIFLAEVASTVNEILLMDYLISETDDASVRAYLVNEMLEQFRTTIFRQTMFAEFEMITHETAESGEPLTVESMNAIYRSLNEKYYGPDVVIDGKIDLEWARIPHFYNAFYVYQYATGYSAAVAFANGMLKGGAEKVAAYTDFLKSGGSAYSIDILKIAGVDMSSPAPVEEALTVFRGLIDKMEGLV